MSRTVAEELERLAGSLQRLAERARAAEVGEALYTREDVERIVESRLARERRKARQTSQDRF